MTEKDLTIKSDSAQLIFTENLGMKKICADGDQEHH
jgi:hypothetical protein